MWGIIGASAARFVGLLPWAGPRALLFALYVSIAVMAIGVPTASVWMFAHSKVAIAVADCNSAWRVKLANAEKEYAEQVAAAISEAADVAGPIASSDIGKLCEMSRHCRDRANGSRSATIGR